MRLTRNVLVATLSSGKRIEICVAAEFVAPNQNDGCDGVDSKIKGSVKFIEIPGGDTAMLPAGGGASVYYSDAVVARGGQLANYAEYSGDPPDWAVEVLTEKICSLPRIKNIIVGGAIANFTDVKKTFGGIIAGFRKAKSEGKLNGVRSGSSRRSPRKRGTRCDARRSGTRVRHPRIRPPHPAHRHR